MFAIAISESMCHNVADQNIQPNAIAYPKRNSSLQWNE
jgi:hypothetical protein